MPKIKTKHHTLDYKLIGQQEGESGIIFFPAFGCHADFCFDEIIHDLFKEHNLLLFNYPAHGSSEVV